MNSPCDNVPRSFIVRMWNFSGRGSRGASPADHGYMVPAGAVFSRGILLSHYGDRWVGPLLGQVYEVLVPDGGFAILDFLNALARYDYPANPDNKTYYTGEQIQSHAKEAGFRRVSILGEPNRRVLMLLAER